MPELGREIKLWRRRLDHAERLWRRNGWKGDRNPSTMRMLIDFYRGEHWKHGTEGLFATLADQDLVTVNKVFSVWNTIQARIAGRDPRVRVRARTERARKAAIRATALLQYDVEEQRMMRQWNRALGDHGFGPLGIVRHGYTPMEEYETEASERKRSRRLQMYRPARPDRPWIKREAIWDVLLDPLAESWDNDGSIRWCAFRKTHTMQELQDLADAVPGFHLRDGIRPNLASPMKDRPEELLDAENEDLNDLVEYYTVYDAVERKWFELTLEGDEKELREPDDFPIPWEHLPIDVFAVNEQMDTPVPLPIMENVIPLQQELDRVRTIISLVARNTRRIIGVQQGGMEGEELEKLVDAEVIEVLMTNDMPSNVIQEIKSGVFPQELLVYAAQIEQDIREEMGQSLMDRAQRINVETAREAGQVQLGSDLHTNRMQQRFDAFIESSLQNYAHGRRATMSREELVPILGLRNARLLEDPFLRVRPEDLREDLDFKIEAGSTLAFEEATERQLALADLQVAQSLPELNNVPNAMAEYWIARGKDPAEMMRVDPTVAEQGPGGLSDRIRQSGIDLDPQVILSMSGGRA